MPWYRLRDGVEGGKDLPTLSIHFEPGETREVPAELTDPDFEPVPAPKSRRTSEGGEQ
jgi:hypothetical protein